MGNPSDRATSMKRPINYYDNLVELALRRQQNLSATDSPFSDVLLVTNHTSGEVVRVSSLFSLLWTTDESITTSLAALMAVYDFNQRQSPYSDLSNLSSCNFFLTIGYGGLYETQLELAREWQSEVLFLRNGVRPMVLLGGTTSSQSLLLAKLGASSPRVLTNETADLEAVHYYTSSARGVNDLVEGEPVISPSATSSELNDFALFSRTIPNNRGDAEALCLYLQSIGVQLFATLFVADSYGRMFLQDLMAVADSYNMTVRGFSYQPNDPNATIAQLQRSGFRYIFAVLDAATWKVVCERSYEANMLGNPEYAWIFSDSIDTAIRMHAVELDHPLGLAMNHSAVLSLRPPPQQFKIHDQRMRQAVQDDNFVSYFASRFPSNTTLPNPLVPDPSIVSMLTYDAVMVVGRAACQFGPKDQMNGPSLRSTWTGLEFYGASGRVRFDPHTYSRSPTSMTYQLANVITEEAVDRPGVYTTSGRPSKHISIGKSDIVTLRPLLFASGTAIPPRQVPFDQSMSSSIMTFNYVLAACSVLFAVFCIGYSILRRDQPRVRASQPIFLVLVSTGPIFVGLAIVTTSLPETLAPKILNAGCMANAWLMSTGFAITFAALFTKTWRINRVYENAQRFRRVTIRPIDVVWPLVALLTVNIAILTAWTITAPLEWERIYQETSSGQIFSAGGSCYDLDVKNADSGKETGFIVAVVLVNVCALLLSAYQSLKARTLPSEFNENFRVALTSLILLENYFIGIPVLLAFRSSSEVFMLMTGVMDGVFCFGVLLPLFLPIFSGKQTKNAKRRVPNRSSQDIDEPAQRRHRSMPTVQLMASGVKTRLWRSRMQPTAARPASLPMQLPVAAR